MSHIRLLLFLFIFGGAFQMHAQELDSVRAEFFPAKNQLFGFDNYSISQWKEDYKWIEIQGAPYAVPHKSVAINSSDTVKMTLSNRALFNSENLTFKIADSLFAIDLSDRNGDTVKIVLPQIEANYSLEVYHLETLIGQLDVSVYPFQTQSLIVVPLVRTDINRDSLQHSLNSIYKQANLKFSVHVAPFFQPEEYDGGLLSNPNLEQVRFTKQMREIRDAYFESHKSSNAYYVFVVDGFVDSEISGFMVRNKAVAFVKNSEEKLHQTIARQLGFGVGVLNKTWIEEGPLKGSTKNLMDLGGGSELIHSQWESIQRSCRSISHYDDYEDVRTNNGIIGYYFWEEDEKGYIVLKTGNLLKSIKRPFKRNQFSLHLNIDNWFFIPLFTVLSFPICALHLLILLLFAVGSVFIRRKLFKWLHKVIKFRWIFRITVRMIVFSVFVAVYVGSFLLINQGYGMFEVKSGKLDYLYGMDTRSAISTIGDNMNTQLLEEDKMGSEILIKRGEDWFLDKRKRVLYFNVEKEGDKWSKCTFKTDSDTLTIRTKNYNEYAESHYFVFNYLADDGTYTYQKVYNHLGKEVTDKLELKDPAKRILLFVNGYRPTSLGETFEENFDDIRKNGLEFANSKNLIYNFDRYDYWRPWKEIDVLFQDRLNPSETLYADGHFSVETSNHRSLLTFTSLTTSHPERCKEEGNHVCRQTSVSSWIPLISEEIKTVDLYNLEPNIEGFNSRRTNGKIAGRNLQQMLNELPNKSTNDTLYIVAHSMGYAYTLGLIEQLRGKINFGGLYIIAPENASAGKVNIDEWKEVWQYGSDFERNKLSAPCLLDGIAPQAKVGGLEMYHRAYIPEKFYNKMGFYDSHFVGHYTWIFDLPKDATGYIRQR